MPTPNAIIKDISTREAKAIRLVDYLRDKLRESREENRQLWSEVRRQRMVIRELKAKPVYQ